MDEKQIIPNHSITDDPKCSPPVSTKDQPQDAPGTDCVWIRRLSEGEEVHEMSQAKHRHQITCYCLVLCCAAPLEEEVLRKSLTALARKAPQLRLMIRERDDGLWFCEVPSNNLTVDLRMLGEVDVDAAIEKEITTSFQSAVELIWRARLLTSVPGTGTYQLEHLVQEYKHEYTLLLTFHHSITDGFTTMKVCNLLLRLINDVIEGNHIDDDQLGEFSAGEETGRILMNRKNLLDKDPTRKEMVMRAIGKISSYRPLMFEAFPVPEEQKRNTTLHITRQLNEKQTSGLLRFFKSEDLTVNSGFIAIVNLSLIEMFKKRGFKQDKYEICCFNAVNFRRYWKTDSSRSLGCHFGPISLISDTPQNSIDHFIEYAHDIQTNMSDYLENNRTFDECLFLDVTKGSGCKNLDEFFTNPPSKPQFTYSTTNMGDLSKQFTGEGKHVQIPWFTRSNSFHRYNSTLINALQTFRGRFLLGLDYNARNISKEVINEYADTIMDFLHNIASQMC